MKNTAFHYKKNSTPSSPLSQSTSFASQNYDVLDIQGSNQENIKLGKQQVMIHTQAKGIMQSNHGGSMTTKNSEANAQRKHGNNFFKELTNSLYDNTKGASSVLSNQSRQNVNTQAISVIGPSTGAKSSIIMVPNTNVKMNSIQHSNGQRRDSQQNENIMVLQMNQQQSPVNIQTAKMTTLKKKFTSSGMQAMHQGNQPSISNQSSSCNVTLSQQSQQTYKAHHPVTTPSSAVGSRKNSKDQQQANKPYVNSKSPTPISILSQYSQSQQSRQQTINNVPATLSPKDMNSKVFVLKPNAPSPSNSILIQNGNHSRQQQQSPLNASQLKNSSQHTNQLMMSVNSNGSTKNSSQIFQRVYELQKKYQHINEASGVISAPLSKVSSPDTRNQNAQSNVIQSGYNSNYSSNTNLYASNISSNSKPQPLLNNYLISKKKDSIVNMNERPQSQLERTDITKNSIHIVDSESDLKNMNFEISQRSPAGSVYTQQSKIVVQSPVSCSSNQTSQNMYKNPKEMIIQHIGKYIKKKNEGGQDCCNSAVGGKDEQVNEEILQNLREFLSYLEEKNIINTSKLENNKEEMNNLIKDLMKLDLAKFSKPRCNSSQRRGSASPNVGLNNQSNPEFQNASNLNNHFNMRHNSQQNMPNAQNQFVFNQQSNINDAKSDTYQQKLNQQTNQSSANSRQVPTIQLMINTNVNNFCITPVASQSSINTTKNINTVTNNYNIYPGSPPPQNQESQQLPPKQSNIINQRRGSDSTVLQQQCMVQPQQHPGHQSSAASLQNHKRNVSDNNIIQSKLSNQQQSSKPKGQEQVVNSTSNVAGHRKNMPSMDPNTHHQASRNNVATDNKDNIQQQQNNASELQKSVLSNPNEEIDSNQVTLNESILNEREKIIKFIKAYIKRHNEVPPTTLDYYKFVKLIGKGAFGKVTLGVHKLTGKYVAIKTIDKSYMKDEYSRRKVFQEVYILKKIRHSCVIRLLEVFESPKHFLMVMEYAGGGDLLQYVKKRKRLDEDTARAIFKQIVYGLGHCHCRSVLHRDVKLDNVLMDGEGGVKLCDFGVSRLVKKHQIIKEQCGTPAYLAPEIIIDEGYEGFYADTWSLGVLLYAMLQGTVPFKANNIADLHKLILKGDFEFSYQGISEESQDLLRKMLILTPENRISMPEVLNHPWVREIGEGFEEEDDEHDLKVGATFFRQECMNGIIGTAGNGSQMESGNINYINVENLYYQSSKQPEPAANAQTKIKYSDYCALTEDFMTYRIDEEALTIVESYGYTRRMIVDCINKGEINHATASYYLLIHSTTQ